MKITVNNVELNYEVIGSGDPLIMVHGNGESHEIFDRAAQVLAKHFTCYLIDSRGHGESQKVNEFHYADMAEDIRQFIEALQLKHVTYYGFSDGGIIGLLLAIKYPRILEKMIISGANTRPGAVKMKIFIPLKISSLFRKNPYVDLMMKEPHISKEQLASIEIPTLVLAGSKDLILEKDTRLIAASIPKATLKILDGEDHGSYIVHQSKVADLILEYCESFSETQI